MNKRQFLMVLPVLIALIPVLSCGHGQTLTAITVTPDMVTLTRGVSPTTVTVQYRAVGTFQRPHEDKDITNSVTWSIPFSNGVSINSSGLLTVSNFCGHFPVTASAHSEFPSVSGSLITGVSGGELISSGGFCGN